MFRNLCSVEGGRMPQKQGLLTAVYAAFNRRDVDRVLAFMRPDVDWPNGMEGGRVHGRDEVRVLGATVGNFGSPR